MKNLIMKTLSTALAFTILLVAPVLASSPTPADGVTGGHNSFAIDLYHALAPDEGNLFFSPLSISTALSMAYAGAENGTASEMQDVLHLPASSAALHEGNKVLQAILEDSNLLQANSLWPSLDETLLESFTHSLQANYSAECQALDFSNNPQLAAATINKWVEEKTLGRIKDLLQPDDITPATRLVLANAIVFTGKWQQAFDPAKTIAMPFHLAGGGEVWTKGMVMKTEYMSAEMDGYLVVELPFKGEEISLIIAVPNDVDGLAELEKSITLAAVNIWVKKMAKKELTLTLPRIEMDERVDLAEVLVAMGMKQAFSTKADFSGITGDKGLFIDKVIHQASLKIDEEGVEAAAATAVTFKRFGFPENLKIDRPFMFMIRHRSTGSILFMGRMVNPDA